MSELYTRAFDSRSERVGLVDGVPRLVALGACAGASHMQRLAPRFVHGIGGGMEAAPGSLVMVQLAKGLR